MAFAHPISPILITAAITVLICLGKLRPRFVFLITIVPFIIWDALHFSLRHFFSTNRVGHPSNFAPPVVGSRSEHELIVDLAAILGAAVLGFIGFIALRSAVSIRNRQMITLLACAASAFSLGLGTSYGSEAIFRIELFALPWLAIAAACLPLPNISKQRGKLALGFVVLPLLASYLIAQYGLDAAYATRPQTLHEERIFEDTAPVGSLLIVAGNGTAPIESTARYPVLSFEAEARFVYLNKIGKTESAAAAAQSFGGEVAFLFPNRPAVYFLFTPEATKYSELWGLQSTTTSTEFEQGVLSSPEWQVVSSDNGAILLKLNRR
jgi:hypothetical protein